MPEKENAEQIRILWAEIRKLQDQTTIPFDTEQAFRQRLEIGSFAKLAASSKAGSSEAQVVNEAGMGTYSVANVPDGFREFTLPDGTVIYIPFYTD